MKTTTLFSLFALLLLTACGPTSSSSVAQGTIAKDISVKEFQAMDLTKYHLVDVRTPQEFKAGNIEGSVNIDWNGDAFLEKMAELSKDKGVIVYCKSGGRSSSAMQKLNGHGYEELYNVLGGYLAYAKEVQ